MANPFLECAVCGYSYVFKENMTECVIEGCNGALYITDDSEDFLPPGK